MTRIRIAARAWKWGSLRKMSDWNGFDGFKEWSTYCADPNDSSGMGRRIYEAIQKSVDSGVIAPPMKEVEE